MDLHQRQRGQNPQVYVLAARSLGIVRPSGDPSGEVSDLDDVITGQQTLTQSLLRSTLVDDPTGAVLP